MRASIVAGVAALALAALVPAASSASSAGSCPAAWRGGWQALANRIQAPVYCPTWMPDPLDARIGGGDGHRGGLSRRPGSLDSFFLGEPRPRRGPRNHPR